MLFGADFAIENPQMLTFYLTKDTFCKGFCQGEIIYLSLTRHTAHTYAAISGRRCKQIYDRMERVREIVSFF